MEELGFAPGQNPGLQTRVHRLGAGEPDESGWCPARSTGGRYVVRLPNVFNDFMLTTRTEDGVELQMHYLGTRDDRQVKYTALAWRRPDGKYKGDPLEDLPAASNEVGEVTGRRALTLGGMRGVEFRVSGRSSVAIMRLYRSADTVYQLIVEAPRPLTFGQVEGDAKRFLESFAVVDGDEL
jgi:hypothetical protein